MLAKAINGKVIIAEYSGKIKVGDKILINPTEQTYIDMGFEELPECSIAENQHVEYTVATRKVTKSAKVDSILTGKFRQVDIVDENGNFIGHKLERYTEETPVYEQQETDEEYIVATAVNNIECNVDEKEYSKLKLVTILKQMNIWEQAKNEIEELGLYDEWLASNDVSGNNQLFMQAKQHFEVKYPEIDIDEILRMAEK